MSESRWSDGGITLDRIAIEEAGPDPAAMAAAVHAQLGDPTRPVDVHRIASILDITQIKAEPLANLEGALITTSERSYGSILVNANSPLQRQRFTVAHELCHFLHPHHRPVPGVGFECTASDMRDTPRLSTMGNQRHARQEREANRFAIELLLPTNAISAYSTGPPDLAHVLRLAERYQVSREATARRYVELHHEPVAIVLSQKGVVRYTVQSQTMPRLKLVAQSTVLWACPRTSVVGLAPQQPGLASDWLIRPNQATVATQTLYQLNNFAMTLLWMDQT